MAFKNIKCPWCGKEARITYEENRVYQMKCYSCRNTMLHVDHSFDSAVDFFEHHANLLHAEQDGRLVVLPEPLKRAIVREGGRCFSDFTMDDINNLLEAWDAGRLVVLPCKVGTHVHGKYGNWSGEVMEFSINGDGVQLYVRSGGGGFYCKPEDIEVEAVLTDG